MTTFLTVTGTKRRSLNAVRGAPRFELRTTMYTIPYYLAKPIAEKYSMFLAAEFLLTFDFPLTQSVYLGKLTPTG